MLLEKLLKEFNFSTNIFNWEEFKLFDQYFERILISKGTFLIKEGETERYSYFVFDGILRCWLLTYIIHSGFISGYQNRYGDNLKPPTNVYHRMTA